MNDEVPVTGGDAAQIAEILQPMIGPLARGLRQENEGPYTISQQSVIGTVRRYGPINLKDLAERERLSAPMISRIVAALDDAGILRRVTEPTDRRVCLVDLTDRGLEWLDNEGRRRSQWLASRLESLSEDERRAIGAALPALRRLVDQT